MIHIDTHSGFCFGVVNAIKKAEEELQKGTPLYCLGDIVHNNEEVQRLAALGLITITYEQYSALHDATILLRAHGEPPRTYEIAHENNLRLIDATCPVVLNLQKRIRKTYLEHPDAQLVIFGKRGHAEVIGLQGQTDDKAIVVEGLQDIDKLDFEKDIYLFSQTTKSEEEFQQLISTIEQCVETHTPHADEGQHLLQANNKKAIVTAFDTICGQVRNRVKHIREFAQQHDIVIFVGGRNSSNGKVLYEECKAANPNTFFIERADEVENLMAEFKVQNIWLNPHADEGQHLSNINEEADCNNYQSSLPTIGICGATSTPHWLMEEVKNKLEL